MKKWEKVLSHIQSYGHITSQDVIEKCGGNVHQVSACINYIRKKGYNVISSKINGKDFYHLPQESENKAPKMFAVRRGQGGICHFIFKESDIKIMPTGDWHIDSKKKFDIIWNMMEVYETAGYYFILGGDLVEMAHKSSIADGVYRQKLNPQEQKDMLGKLIKRFSHRILFALRGNHEARTENSMGLQVLKDICREHKVEYVHGRAFVIIETPKIKLKIHAIHRVSGVLRHTKEKNVWRKFQDFSAHFYLGFHGHEGLYDPNQFRIELNPESLKLERERFYSIMSPSLVEYLDSYADATGYLVNNPTIYGLWIKDRGYGVKELMFDREVR